MSGFVDLVCFCCLSDSFQKLCDEERFCVEADEKTNVIVHNVERTLSECCEKVPCWLIIELIDVCSSGERTNEEHAD